MNEVLFEKLIENAGGIIPKDVLMSKEWKVDSEMISEFKSMVEEADCILIVGDYDVDGIVSSKILKDGMTKMNKDALVLNKLPDRFKDGFGIKWPTVDAFFDGIVKTNEKTPGKIKHPLIITCDNGSSSKDAFEYAKKRAEELGFSGYKAIITDHHIATELPDVDLFINPHNDGFDFDDYCGAGVAYKLIEAVNPNGWDKDNALFYAGLATIADVVPLREENWVLARKSIDMLKNAIFRDNLESLPIPIKLLIEKIGLSDVSQCTEGFYGFKLAPTFNAMGRIRDNGAKEVFTFLDRQEKQTPENAEKIIETNNKRKEVVDGFMENLTGSVSESDKARVIWAQVPNIIDGIPVEGICGLFAQGLVNATGMPCIVYAESRTNPDVYKGSGRAPEGFDLHAYIKDRRLLPYLTGGGHMKACGISFKKKDETKLKNAINKVNFADYMTEVELPSPISGCVSLNLSEAASSYAEMRDKFAPFGEGNPEVSFLLHVKLSEMEHSYIGTEHNHLSLNADGIKCLHFNHDIDLSCDDFYLKGHIRPNTYKGQTSLQFIADEVLDSDKVEELLNEEEMEAGNETR